MPRAASAPGANGSEGKVKVTGVLSGIEWTKGSCDAIWKARKSIGICLLSSLSCSAAAQRGAARMHNRPLGTETGPSRKMHLQAREFARVPLSLLTRLRLILFGHEDLAGIVFWAAL